MAGKRRADASGLFKEIAGLILWTASFAVLCYALYKLGGIWASVIPGCLLLMWIGFNLMTRTPPPGGTGTGPSTARGTGTRTGTDPEADYVDPDAHLPTDAFRRYRDEG